MNAEFFSSLSFVNRNEPIEIFCQQKFRGYYVRAQIIETRDAFVDESVDDWGYAYYRISVIYLLKNSFFKNTGHSDLFYSQLGIVNGRTIAEFMQIRNKDISESAKRIAKHINKTEKEYFDESLKTHNSPLLVNIKELNITEPPYITNAINDKRQEIIVDFDLTLDRIEYPNNLSESVVYPKQIYSLLAYNLSQHDEDRDSGDRASDWLYDFFDIAELNYNYDFVKKKEFISILNDIGNLAWQWISKKAFSNRDLMALNALIAKIRDNADPLTKLCNKLLNSLIDDLLANQLISICQFCGTIIQYSDGKKFCSLKSDGRDCGKKARNKRFYSAHREILLPKIRKATTEIRAFYKSKGIKK